MPTVTIAAGAARMGLNAPRGAPEKTSELLPGAGKDASRRFIKELTARQRARTQGRGGHRILLRLVKVNRATVSG